MSIIDSAKDMARKATDSIIDTAESMVGKPKSPKELAKRLVEHLSHGEYSKVAEILSDEAKKYASHLGIEDFALVEAKLHDFKDSMEEIAGNMEDGNYTQVVTKLKELETSIPESIVGNTEISAPIKGLLKDIAKTLEDQDREQEEGDGNEKHHDDNSKKPDFNKLQETVEGYFTKMMSSKE